MSSKRFLNCSENRSSRRYLSMDGACWTSTISLSTRASGCDHLLSAFGRKVSKAMKVVLFCGGLGLRLRDYAENIPKPMATIGYRPILWHVMKYYAHYGHKD